ncbi:BMP family ABC transporter substrate-binding protein [uncultured Sphaerochaeta sp.]|uniref:BMP family ABC transporter substrate-binding protein n=1 Tax=uncultured Sphaerochaeta sp. TaxID=886478 RepID=UPI002A0A4572|nr:BMP family ABC transporter substrate-binding protein [uncultured Sphaerochaeta sp.]
MKKITVWFCVLVLCIVNVTFAGGSKEPQTASKADDSFKALYLVNGNLGDKGFYDSAASGFYTLRDEDKATIKIVEMGRNEASYEGFFLDASEQDWNVIVSGTWSVKELAESVAKQFPDKNYIFFDGVSDVPNLMGIAYKSNETAFMAGSLAALMLDSGDAKIDASKRILGFIGSMDTPNINDFLIGYIDGIQYIDPSIKVLTSYVGSFEDVSKCMEMTTQLYNQGAQIVYAPASQSILGAVTASSKSDKYLIACDTDIWTAMEGTDANAVRNVLSSSLKKVGESLVVAMRGLQDGTMSTKENYTLGLKSGSVGLADNANYQKLVPANIRTKLGNDFQGCRGWQDCRT